MTIERIEALHRARPFKQFDIHLADGRKIRVRHPEFLSRSPMGRTIVVNESESSVHHIDLLLVTDLEVVENGHARRRAGRRR